MKRPREDSLTSCPANGNATSSQTLSQLNNTDAPTAKFTQLSSPDHSVTPPTSISCQLPPHVPLYFPTALHYERHYTSAHSNRCISCLANLPSSRFLALHISENHDPIALARRDRGEKIYACFVEGCEKLCIDWKKRRSHMVDKHGFPRNYDFFIVNTGVDGRRSLLRAGVDEQGHRRSSRERTQGGEIAQGEESQLIIEGPAKTMSNGFTAVVENEEAVWEDLNTAQAKGQEEVDGLTKSLSSLRMVPRSLTFGKPRMGTGFGKS
nr:zinc finger protein 511 [Quercus suber]